MTIHICLETLFPFALAFCERGVTYIALIMMTVQARLICIPLAFPPSPRLLLAYPSGGEPNRCPAEGTPTHDPDWATLSLMLSPLLTVTPANTPPDPLYVVQDSAD